MAKDVLKFSDIVLNIDSVDTRQVPAAPTSVALPTTAIGVVLDADIKKNNSHVDFSYIRSFDLNVTTLGEAIRYMIDTPPNTPGNNRKKKVSVAIRAPTYLCVRLSSDLNWQFMADAPPFSIPVRGVDAEFYDAIKYELNAGQLVVSQGRDGCKVAVMRVHPPAYDYEDRFNINIELLMRDNQNPPQPQKLPIIIDPEVGWPNGTQP